MRGGAQAHLVECDDGSFYVVKFRNNPQHPRILVNEWLASSLLAYLNISTPDIAVVNVTPEFIAGEPSLYIEQDSRTVTEPGRHFGSRFPGHPSKTRIYDFLPETLLGKVVNGDDFLGALVFDKWTGNVDARQAIFTRLPPGVISGSPTRGSWSASMIDQGGAFGAGAWRFFDSPLQGLYFTSGVYRGIRSLNDFQPWLDLVMTLPRAMLEETRDTIPPEWIRGDEQALDALIDRLMSRREGLPDLIACSIQARQNPFPDWKG